MAADPQSAARIEAQIVEAGGDVEPAGLFERARHRLAREGVEAARHRLGRIEEIAVGRQRQPAREGHVVGHDAKHQPVEIDDIGARQDEQILEQAAQTCRAAMVVRDIEAVAIQRHDRIGADELAAGDAAGLA